MNGRTDICDSSYMGRSREMGNVRHGGGVSAQDHDNAKAMMQSQNTSSSSSINTSSPQVPPPPPDSQSDSQSDSQPDSHQPDPQPHPDDYRDEDRAKAIVILDACSRQDIDNLKALAVTQGGFLSDAIRRQAWPVLLGSTPPEDIEKEQQSHLDLRPPGQPDLAENPASQEADAGDKSWRELPPHRDEHQVGLDVERSFVYYPRATNQDADQSQAQLDLMKNGLSDLIVETLRRYPYLCYFQGYHDICQVFLLVLPPPLRAAAVARLSVLRIRDFMLPNLAPAISQLRLIPDILRAVDPVLYRHLPPNDPFYALAGTITMFAHDIQEYGDIARLFDALLAHEQVFSIYLFASIVLKRKEELFDTPANESDMLHFLLSKLPKPLKLEELITETLVIFEKHPPESLPSWRKLSSSSVLKTARNVKVCAGQSMEEGHSFFRRQLGELQWAEKKAEMANRLRTYKRPAKGVALAIAVGIAAIYLRRSPGTWTLLASLWSRKF